MNYQLYCPKIVNKSIFDIDYDNLLNKNKNILLFDIDNTLLSYLEKEPSKEVKDLFLKLSNKGFKLVLVSNNNETRVNKIKSSLECNVDCYYKLNKPSSNKLLKIINKNQLPINQIVMIGDQILTDIYCGNKLGVTTLLVKSLDRSSEHWYTTINRLREKKILNKIRKNNEIIYQQIMELNRS